MNITVTGSLGNISQPLVRILVDAGHHITVISSNPDRVAAIEATGAKAAIGSISDVSFLTAAFTGADVVYTMVPPDFSVPDFRAYIREAGHNYAAAIKAAGVKHVVNLSSIGAHLPGGTGPIAGLHDVEGILDNLEGVSVKHLRPGFFYVNFFTNIDMIKHMNIIGANYGPADDMVLVHPADIAAAAAEEIQQPFTNATSVRYVASDERNTRDIATVLGTAIGKPELQWISFTDEDALNGMTGAGLPEPIAKAYVEMGTAVRSGKLWEDYAVHKPQLSDRKLEQFATEFAARY